MTEFAEADARLAAMHGYAGLPPAQQPRGGTDPFLGDPVTGEPYRPPHAREPVTLTTGVVTVLYPTREDVERLEAKLDRLIQALRAGAIGQWGNG